MPFSYSCDLYMKRFVKYQNKVQSNFGIFLVWDFVDTSILIRLQLPHLIALLLTLNIKIRYFVNVLLLRCIEKHLTGFSNFLNACIVYPQKPIILTELWLQNKSGILLSILKLHIRLTFGNSGFYDKH